MNIHTNNTGITQGNSKNTMETKSAKTMNGKVTLISALLVFASVQYAQASSTIVTDAIGTQEIWTFEENLGVQNMISRVNQVDGKGVYQTWDANNNLLTKTDTEGQVTTYTYNATNQRTSKTEASGTVDARTTSYEYVSADIDIITKTTTPSIFAGNSKEVITSYDANLNAVKTEIKGFNPDGVAVSRAMDFEYDNLGKITKIDGYRTDVNDFTTFTYYDCSTGAECGQLQSVANALGHTTTYDSYDANSQLLQMTSPNGVVTTNTYHPRGWLLTRTQTAPNSEQRVTSYEYDTDGLMTQVTSPDGTVLSYEYDSAHDLRAISDNVNNRVEYTYDAKGNRNVEKTLDPNGTLVREIQTAYDIRNFVESINTAGSVTQMVNDAVGKLTSQTDPNQNPSTTSEYDGLYRLTNTIDALSNNTGYEYNVADQLIKVTAPNGAVTQYAYDDLGNLLSETSPDRGTITYTHDNAGNVLTQTDARGITVTYQYDALNRLTDVTYPNTSENVSYVYDQVISVPSVTNLCHALDDMYAVGRLCQVVDESGQMNYRYDVWGNVESHMRQQLGQFYLTRYQYDDANRITQMVYPNGRIVDYERDVIGRVINVTTKLSLQADSTNVVTARTYRADGLLTVQTLGNDIVETRTYDLQGRVTNIETGVDGQEWDYEYDANGNILAIDKPKESRSFIYDELDRLIEDVKGVNATADDQINNFFYEYDANGNRLKKNNRAYEYNDFSNAINKDGNVDIQMDAVGNVLTFTNGKTFTHSDSNRLRTVSKNGTLKATYFYNANNQRTQKAKPNKKTEVFHYDLAGNLILKTWADAHPREDYIWVDGQLAQYAHTKGNKVKPEGATTKVPDGMIKEEISKTFVTNDHLSTPRLGTSQDKTLTWRWESDGFNAKRPNNDPDQDGKKVHLKIGFPGQYWDGESGLYYNWNRYFDPKAGRYITSDPIGLKGGLNTFGYVYQNPLMYVDPDGRRVKWNGTTRGGGLTIGVGFIFMDYEFTSECKCNKRVTVKGQAYLGSVGAGGKGASTGGAVMFTPGQCPIGEDFAGSAWYSGISSVVIGGATFLPTLILGQARSSRELIQGPSYGVDVSVVSSHGYSNVQSVTFEECCGG